MNVVTGREEDTKHDEDASEFKTFNNLSEEVVDLDYEESSDGEVTNLSF